jgi:hypothetical protein
MTTEAFARELEGLGVSCGVELRGRVAMIVVSEESAAAIVAGRRQEIVELAKGYGFATAALELTGDAALLRD